MRRSQKEKEITHKRIVQIASRRFREQGYNGISVADIMAEAGLTHGGFYKHFESRDALIAEATSSSFIEEKTEISQQFQDTGASRIEAFLTIYLSERHLSNPGGGCPVATLATEVARTPAARDTFEFYFKRYMDWVADMLEDSGPEKKKLAGAIICAAAGAYSVARSLNDKETALELLETMKELLFKILNEESDCKK